ncbi:MAG: hypothetical protein LBG19_04590 [Prevotellaceae bacterium]|nr:hypothetical protein [Prevotellaceae bacterium]
MLIINTTNATADNGGGVFINDSDPYLTNLTIAGNTAIEGSEMLNTNSHQNIRNTVIWNKEANPVSNKNGSVPEYYYSLVKNITNSSNGNIDGGINPMFTGENGYFLSFASPRSQ